ncbi:hypothetical protein RZN25_03855 [Bacillaceae bacterium S4-13-56]
MKRKILITVLTLLLMLPTIGVQAGSLGKSDPTGEPGTWYLGSQPSNYSISNYPILFVHGLNSSASTWWDGNDMYSTAFDNGYNTAFVDLYPTNDMWDNGYLLSQRIRDIYNHFEKKVVIVGHSKGGVDAQSAIVHYGASPYVEKVITLSTPHHGSELADLAYSSWAGWLAGILGSKSDATYSLQTGYMSYFRSVTDSHYNVDNVPFYTFGGRKWGSFGSSLYWGGLYLRSYGQNDGAVTVRSSRLPYATEIKVGDWNHSTIKEGSSTFSLFEPYLKEHNYYLYSGSNEQQLEDQEVSSFIRGGIAKGKQIENFHVEENTNKITFNLISNQSIQDLMLMDPNGNTQTSIDIKKATTDYFKGAYHHNISISEPTAGEWTVISNSSSNPTYLMEVEYDSPFNEDVKLSPDGKKIKIETKNKKIKLKSEARIEFYKNGKLKQKQFKTPKAGEIILPDLGAGVYNVTIDMEGKVGEDKFHRTKVKTVYIDQNGKAYH